MGNIMYSKEERLGFHCWDNPSPVGKHYAFGWLTGIDSDLICVFPDVKTRVLEHYALSPACHNRPLALVAFIVKRLLFMVDPDLQYRMYEKDNQQELNQRRKEAV